MSLLLVTLDTHEGNTRHADDITVIKPITRNTDSSNRGQITSLKINKTEELIARSTGDSSRMYAAFT